MGFFDRFSKSFRGKKDNQAASKAAPPSALSTFPPPSVNKANSEKVLINDGGGVAVAELPNLGAAVTFANSNGSQSPSDFFESEFDQDLDSAFASLEQQVAAQPANESSSIEMSPHDQVVVENLFADIAANYARPIKNFVFELKRGTATKDWMEICRPAMQGITRSAEGMGLHLAAQRMIDFEAALSLAQGGQQRVIGGEVRDLLLWCYEDLVKVMPQAFLIGTEEQQREGVIINSLLMQLPDVGRVSIEKLYRAGLTSLDTLYLARGDDLAVATGIPKELSERICAKFQAYRAGLEATTRDVADVGQRGRLAEFVVDLRRQHEGFVRASEDPHLANEKRDFRQQRQSCVLWINVLLAEVGELDLVNELQKMSFERRIQRLEEFLASGSAA